MSHRPPPQWTSTTRPPCDRSATSWGSSDERLLEEDRDVLGGQPLDGDAVAVRAVAHRLAGPEEVGHPAPVERGDRRVHELAAQVFGAELVEEDHRDVLVDRSGGRPRASRGRARRPPRPTPRPPAGGCPVAAASSAGVIPAEPGFAEPGEQAQLDAEVDEPRAVEAAEAGDQVVESVVEGHRRPIVACWNAAMGAGRVP